MKTSKYPIAKILFPYIIGIFIGYFCHLPVEKKHFWGIITLAFWLLGLFFLQVRSYNWQWMRDIALFTAFLFAGITATLLRLPDDSAAAVAPFNTQNCWTVRIVDFPTVKEKSVKTVVEMIAPPDSGNAQSLRHAMLYLQLDDNAAALQYGDILFVRTQWAPVAPPTNPDAFDYKAFLRRKGIVLTAYTASDAWVKVGHHIPDRFRMGAYHLQHRLSDLLRRSGMSGQEYDIIAAILLGNDETMEPTLKQSYTAAGVSHILCVSGMHVGIIFMILNFILKPLDYFPKMRISKALLLLAAIWLYASITGLSPSVTRSASMFTFVTIGTLIRRKTTIFHSLFASLFILLTYNPLLLFEIGFQFSYLAVFGIVLLQPGIGTWMHFKSKALQYVWELVSVSVAAQISTFPLSVHYFGQFPNYFILSNLSVITLSFIIMISGVVLLCVSFLPLIAHWVSVVLTWEIRGMNRAITFIEALPGSVSQNLDCSTVQVILLYAFIAVLFLAFTKKRRTLFWSGYLLFFLFSTTLFIRKINLLQQSETTIYAIRKSSAISFCHQQRAVLFADTITGEAHPAYGYSIQGHARKQHAEVCIVPIDTARFRTDFVIKEGNFLQDAKQSYYLLRRKERLYATSSPIAVDVLVLRQNPVQEPGEVWRAIHFRKVVADASNTTFYIQRWRTFCETHHIDFEVCDERDARRRHRIGQ